MRNHAHHRHATKNLMRNSALALLGSFAFLAAPVTAQTTPQQPQTAAQPPAAVATTGTQQPIGSDQLKDALKGVNVEDRTKFNGDLVRARSPEGYSVLFLVGAKDMKGEKSVEGSRDKFRGQLTTAGFKNIERVSDAQVIRGELEDMGVIAMVGERGWRGKAGPAQGDTPNVERFRDHLEKAGLGDREEFNGKLLRAHSNGQTIFVLVGPEDFKGGESIEFSAGDLNKFQQRGFQNAELASKVKMVRSKLDDDTIVIALAGSAITAEPN